MARLLTILLILMLCCPAGWAQIPARDVPALDPATFTEGDIPDWVARWELARVLSYAEQYAESVTEYQKLLQEKPDLLQARAEMAQVLFYKGDTQAAHHELTALPTENLPLSTSLIIAELYAAFKEDTKAEPLFQLYLAQYPEDHQARLKLAEMYSWVERYSEAVREYEVILNALPQDIQIRRRYAFVLSWMGRHAEAAEQLRRSLDAN